MKSKTKKIHYRSRVVACGITLLRWLPMTSVLPLKDDTMLYNANDPMITAPNLAR